MSEVLTLEAASKGSWGEKLKASVNYKTKDTTDATLFNITIFEDKDGGMTETFLNVSTDEDTPRFLPRVLEQGSQLVRVSGAMTTTRPAPTAIPASPPSGKMLDFPIAATIALNADGDDLETANYIGPGTEDNKEGIYALRKADLFNLLSIPPPTRDGDTDPDVYSNAAKLCVDKRAMLIVDSPFAWGESAATAAANAIGGLEDIGIIGTFARNAALYFPRIRQSDPLRDGQTETFVPSGMIAGIMARTDTNRGVWKAPAGIDASLNGVRGLQVNLSDDENGLLNPLGINCLRSFPVTGRVVWGARTLRGADQFTDEWKYIPVRRTALFIEESLFRGTKWVVFEPNDEPLWAQIRLNVGAFMQNLFRQGRIPGHNTQRSLPGEVRPGNHHPK